MPGPVVEARRWHVCGLWTTAGARRELRRGGTQHRAARTLRSVTHPRTSPPVLLPVLVAVPALVIAGLGLAHPTFLTPETAERWRLAHLLLLPVFPLVGVSIWVVLRGERGALAWLSRVLAFGWAVLYGALDAIAGLGAPQQVIRTAERGDPRPPIEDLFEIGDRLGELGVLSLAASAAVAAVVLARRTRNPFAVAGGALVVVCCYPLLRHHVFPPRGVLAMVGIGVGLALLELGRRARTTDGAGRTAHPGRT